eukprot:CAMPEP_0197416622 /NCGR_PEP_ID=MMETSP1170-20131217/2897_1 /TAXON_ID=54406 /ORGANISM="Sarcinochrysis sp, Strain CCMP770" /LENGTH=108 /DNA_ID=CAMNT_0042943533 /DNA_START=314 /DNA_END=636 /DNA_ORIENTATION=-
MDDVVRTIDCGGVRGMKKWSGICACNDKVYCAPFNADSILVIDAANSDVVRTIDCGGVRGPGKWIGICACNDKVYCAPNDADSILVIDAANSDVVRTTQPRHSQTNGG